MKFTIGKMNQMSKLTVELVHPDYQDKVFDTLSIPLGMAWLSAYLKREGFSVKCHDLTVSPEDKESILQGKYDVIGFQLHSLESLEESLRLIKEARQIHPLTKVIVGGIAASFLWNRLLDEEIIDFIVVGEGEETMVELLNNIDNNDISKLEKIKGIAFRQGSQKKFTGYREFIKDLDSLPLPDRDAFDWKLYQQWSVVTSRGCPYKCSFCSSQRFWQGTIRVRSAENIYEELIELAEKYNVKKIFILDDVFSINKSRVKELMHLIINGKHKFELACLTRVNLIDKELLELFKKAGCVEISYGVESANQETLDLINKGITIPQIRTAIQLTKEVGIRVRCSFIFGLPNETKHHVLNTINFILETLPDEVQIYPFAPYPETPFFQDPDKYGIKILSQDFSRWKKDALEPIAETRYLTKKDIVDEVYSCIAQLKDKGYVWIPGDKKPGKYPIEKCVMTEFSPIQSLYKDKSR